VGFAIDVHFTLAALADHYLVAVVTVRRSRRAWRQALSPEADLFETFVAAGPGGMRHPRYGIGRRLVDWLMESAVIAGMASVHLELRADNEAARRFYRALGFSETVLMPRYYNGREAAMRMIRVLRSPGPLPLGWAPPVLGQK
jgi:GNAT superfamily N-acetyltransferase